MHKQRRDGEMKVVRIKYRSSKHSMILLEYRERMQTPQLATEIK